MLQMLLLRQKKHGSPKRPHDQRLKPVLVFLSSKPNHPAANSPSRLNWPSQESEKKNCATAWSLLESQKVQVNQVTGRSIIIDRVDCFSAQYPGNCWRWHSVQSSAVYQESPIAMKRS